MSRQRTGIPNIPLCRLSGAVALLLSAVVLPAVTPRAGSLDAEFSKLHFAEWAAKGKQTQIHWVVNVDPAYLSAHQRLIVRTQIEVDGRELEKRRGEGEFTALMQLQDSAGRLWQNHTSISLASLKPGIQSNNIQIIQYAFVLPGEYSLSLAICDTATKEYSFTVRKLSVAPPKNDPLPDAWTGLPAVEYIRSDAGAPDIWFLPENNNRLNLPVPTLRPVHVEVLVNTTPSERASGSVAAMRRNMGLLIPALKVISDMRLERGSVDTALLNLTDRRVVFEQKDIHELDWDRMRRYFLETNPGVIDVHALEGQWKMRRFFWDEVNRRIGADEAAARVVIILSGAAFLEDQEPVDPSPLPQSADRRLIYIRYRTPGFRIGQRPRARPGARPLPPPNNAMGRDDLERTVEPLGAQFYDAVSAEEFRRILAAVIRQISAL